MIDLPLVPTCPAAEVIRGVSPGRAAVICGVKKLDAGRTDGILERKEEGVVVVEAEDPSTIYGFCCGTAAPPTDPKRVVREALTPEHDRSRIPQSYVCCNVWEAERDRAANGRVFGKFERPVPEPDSPLGEQRFTRAELDALVGRRDPA